jgi:hypothetical protein
MSRSLFELFDKLKIDGDAYYTEVTSSSLDDEELIRRLEKDLPSDSAKQLLREVIRESRKGSFANTSGKDGDFDSTGDLTDLEKAQEAQRMEALKTMEDFVLNAGGEIIKRQVQAEEKRKAALAKATIGPESFQSPPSTPQKPKGAPKGSSSSRDDAMNVDGKSSHRGSAKERLAAIQEHEYDGKEIPDSVINDAASLIDDPRTAALLKGLMKKRNDDVRQGFVSTSGVTTTEDAVETFKWLDNNYSNLQVKEAIAKSLGGHDKVRRMLDNIRNDRPIDEGVLAENAAAAINNAQDVEMFNQPQGKDSMDEKEEVHHHKILRTGDTRYYADRMPRLVYEAKRVVAAVAKNHKLLESAIEAASAQMECAIPNVGPTVGSDLLFGVKKFLTRTRQSASDVMRLDEAAASEIFGGPGQAGIEILITSPKRTEGHLVYQTASSMSAFKMRKTGATFVIREFNIDAVSVAHSEFRATDGSWVALFELGGRVGPLADGRPGIRANSFILDEKMTIFSNDDVMEYGYVGGPDWGFVLRFDRRGGPEATLGCVYVITGDAVKPLFSQAYKYITTNELCLRYGKAQSKRYTQMLDRVRSNGFTGTEGFGDWLNSLADKVGFTAFRHAMRHNEVIKLTDVASFKEEADIAGLSYPTASQFARVIADIDGADAQTGHPKGWTNAGTLTPKKIEFSFYDSALGALGLKKSKDKPSVKLFSPPAGEATKDLRIALIKPTDHPTLNGIDFFAKEKGQKSDSNELRNVMIRADFGQPTPRTALGFPSSFVLRLDLSSETLDNILHDRNGTHWMCGVAQFEPAQDDTGAVDTFAVVLQLRHARANMNVYGTVGNMYIVYKKESPVEAAAPL